MSIIRRFLNNFAACLQYSTKLYVREDERARERVTVKSKCFIRFDLKKKKLCRLLDLFLGFLLQFRQECD